MIKCSNCGAQLDDDALFCTECGTKQEPQKNTCPHCGAEIDDDSIFCAECGTKLDVVTAQPVEQSLVEPPIEEPKEKTVVAPPATEQPIVDKQPLTEQTKDSNAKTTDINPISKTNNNSLKYIMGGVVCAVLIVAGGWFVYDKYFGSLLDKLELVTPIKFVESVSETALYAEPNVDADISCTVSQGFSLPVIGDCGEWYKVVSPGATQEEYIKKTECKDIALSPIPDMNATYLTIDFPNYGSCYIVHRSDGKQLVLSHLIRPDGREYIELGKYHEGVYVSTYSVEIENHYWTEYRKVISTDNGVVSLIDFNQIPEEHLTDPFEDVIKNNEKSISTLFGNALPVLGFRKINISTISDFYKANHPYMEGNIAGKYDFVMFLDVYGDRVEGRYRVLQNQDGFVNLSGSITMGKVEVYEYNKDGSQTGYYFSGTLNDKGFSGKYLSTENKKLKMSFTSKVK